MMHSNHAFEVVAFFLLAAFCGKDACSDTKDSERSANNRTLLHCEIFYLRNFDFLIST